MVRWGQHEPPRHTHAAALSGFAIGAGGLGARTLQNEGLRGTMGGVAQFTAESVVFSGRLQVIEQYIPSVSMLT
jgi:hypothetical protein